MEEKGKQLNGLNKSFSPLGMWAFSIGTSMGWGSFIVTCNTYLQKSGVLGTIFGLIVGMAVILVITWNLQYMITNSPGAGGLYSFEKKIGGKELGFVAYWFILLTYLAILWANMTSVPLFVRFFLGNIFKFGFRYTVFGYEVWLGEAILSIAVLFLVGALCARSTKITDYIMSVAALVFTFSFIVCGILAITKHESTFSYEPLYYGDAGALRQIVRVAAISPWAFIGFENIAHFSEEYDFAIKKVRGILIRSVIFTTALYIIVSLLSVSAYPPEYDSWTAYFQDMGNLQGIEAVPAFYVAYHYLGENGVSMLLVALFAVILTSLIGNMMALSRLLYAAGRNGEASKALGIIGKHGTPANAINAIIIFSALIPFLGRTTIGWIVDVTTLGATVIYGLTSHAVFRHAQKENRSVEKYTGIAGMVIMVFFIMLVLIPGLLPFDAMATESYILFIAWSIYGLAYFRWIIRKDNDQEYRHRMLVWALLLAVVLFASMMWASRATENAANEAVETIFEYHQAHPDHDSTLNNIEAREHFLQEQADKISRTNILYTLLSLGLFLISSGIMFNNYRDSQKLVKRMISAETEAKSAKRIADLRESIAVLLDNMPAITYSKDAETGVYIACNQAFADYCMKESPVGVVGLTSHQIFDKKTADHFVKQDKKALEMDGPYIIYEEAADAAGNKRMFQTTKLKFRDANGHMCILGMSLDETEMMQAKKDTDIAQAAYKEALNTSAIYEGFLEALAEEYFDLYYVDMETEEYIEYGSITETGQLSKENRGKNFFVSARDDALVYLYEEDQKIIVEGFYKERVLDDIKKKGTFNIQYRLMIGGVPTYVNMKATKIPGDDRHIIIGVNNVDSQVKDRMAFEKAKEEEKTYLRLAALNGNLIVFYIVDPETNYYKEFNARTDYKKLNISTEDKDFFESTYENGLKTVYSEDQMLFVSAIRKNNILNVIERSGVFELDYRLVMGGNPTYIRFKAATVEEDGKKMLIVGLLDIDAQVRHEQEYANNLSIARKMATTDELTGAKNKTAYTDLENEINNGIKESGNTEFAVVVCDINGLKIVNDTMGHKAGDIFIKSAFTIICNVFKHSPVFRIGGDEFVIICQGHDYEHIDELMDEMNLSNTNNKKTGEVQIACGMARFDEDENVGAVFEKADELMYRHKAQLKDTKTK